MVETAQLPDRRRRSRAKIGISIGAALGASTGALFILLTAGAGAYRTAAPALAVIDATHLPPLLRLPGEKIELRYDVHCAPLDEVDPSPCDARGRVFVRLGGQGAYRALPLSIENGAAEGRYVARVPDALAVTSEDVTYYATFESQGAGTLTLPLGGARAPQRSATLREPVSIALGAHAFGRTQRAAARVFEARWGDGPTEVGLENGRNLAPIGASSFDVDAAGAVYVLDHVHRQVVRSTAFGATRSAIPVRIDGTVADLAVDENRTLYVLESARAGGGPVLRTFGPSGEPRGTAPIAERTATQVRVGAAAPLVLQQPSGQWMPVAAGARTTDASQALGGTPGRALSDGSDVVVLRKDSEIRVQVTARDGTRRSWRVASSTPLAEVQVAEPLGSRFLLVVRVYSDSRDEFVALVLGPRGLVRAISLDSADWAETAPLSRFRVVGSSLYQLGSTPSGVFVDRYELEVGR